MDKNTLIGFLLIAALLFGYSWFSRPSQEEVAAMRQAEMEAVQREQALLDETQSGNKFAKDGINAETDTLTEAERLKMEFGEFSTAASGKDSVLTLQNEMLELAFSTKGGQLAKARLKNYQTYDSLPLILFDGEKDNDYGFIFKSMGRVIDSKNMYFTPTLLNDSTLVMSLITDGGSHFDITYTLPAGSYMLKMNISQSGMEKVLPRNTAHLDFYWNQQLRSQEKGACLKNATVRSTINA